MPQTKSDTKALVAELLTIERLTRAEAQIARVRMSQAQRTEIRQELADNADEADARAERLQATLRSLGGTPDVLAEAVGRVTALAKVAAEQAQPFSEALLGDLAMEHQLRDRVVFARVLAEANQETAVADMMVQLERAHTETIEWITVRLAEVAQGGPVALAPTTTQAAVGQVARLSVSGARRSAALLNKAADALRGGRAQAQKAASDVRERAEETVSDAREQAEKTMSGARERAEETVHAVEEVAQAGRDAALARTEETAPAKKIREAARETRKDLGTIEADALPIKDYDDLTVEEVSEQVEGLNDPEDVRVVLAYEQAHKDRKGVSTVTQERLSELAADSVNV